LKIKKKKESKEGKGEERKIRRKEKRMKTKYELGFIHSLPGELNGTYIQN
jgi:hypothetical protein